MYVNKSMLNVEIYNDYILMIFLARGTEGDAEEKSKEKEKR